MAIKRSDDPVWQAAYDRFWTLTLECEWCGTRFTHQTSPTGGNKPHYCCEEHRRDSRRAYYKWDVFGNRRTA